MKLIRSYALIKRFVLLFIRDTHRLIDQFYWPLLDILLWGFTGFWLQSQETPDLQLGLLLLSGLVYWTYAIQLNKEIAWNLLDEFWSSNFTNLFASPLELSEWMAAVMATGFVRGVSAMLFCSAAVWFIYGLNVYSIGIYLIPLLGALTIFGWALGYITASFLIFYGQKVQILTWITGWFFAPFVGVFYPVEVLPLWAQKLSYCLPPTYVLKEMRSVIMDGTMNYTNLFIAYALAIAYLIIGMIIFKLAFEQSKKYGLARLERYE